MAELGDEASRFHEEIGHAAEKVDVVIGVGPLARAYEPDAWAADAADAVARCVRIRDRIDPDPEWSAAYGHGYERYRLLYPSLRRLEDPRGAETAT